MKKTLLLSLLITLIVNILQSQTPKVKWWFDVHDSGFGSAAAADIDSDSKLEIVFGCYRNDSSVYALNAEDGTLLWKRNLSAGFEGCNDVAPIIYDVDQDGLPEVVVPSSCNPRTFCFEGATGNTEWETLLHGSDSPPTISDIDNDGKPEILHGNFGGSVSCLNGENGSVAWDLSVDPNSWIQTAPTILDVDNDGQLDFVVANWSYDSTHKIFCYRGDTQQLIWDTDLPGDVMYHGASHADLDGDGKMELVIGSYDGNVYCLNAEDGSKYWDFSFPVPFYVGAPTSIADLNNDGKYEVVVMDSYMVGVLSDSGTLIWDFTMPGFGQSFRGAAISDINNDNILDLVFGATNGVLYALSGDDGAKIWDIDLAAHYGSTDFEIDHGPVIADFDNDGFLDVFVVGGFTEYPNFQNNYGRAYAISTESAGGPDWLMFRRDSVRSGSIPIPVAPNALPDEVVENLNFQTYPNPSIGVVKIAFTLTQKANIKVGIYDMLGREIAILADGPTLPGIHSFIWNEAGLHPSGVYACKLEVNGVIIGKQVRLVD